MRHKQTSPKRKRVLVDSHNEAAGSDGDAADQHQQQQQGQQQQHPSLSGRPAEPDPEYHYAVAAEVGISTQTQHVPVGGLAEFVVATKAAGRPPADAAPDTITVQLFQKQQVRWQPRPHQVLLFSWRCPGEDDFGPKHEVRMVRSSTLWPRACTWPGGPVGC